jgi:hypothetical protein
VRNPRPIRHANGFLQIFEDFCMKLAKISHALNFRLIDFCLSAVFYTVLEICWYQKGPDVRRTEF